MIPVFIGADVIDGVDHESPFARDYRLAEPLRQQIPGAFRVRQANCRFPGTAPDDVTPDPPPVKPEKPLPSDCCESGCDCCVFDLYAEALAQYQVELAAWCARNPGRDANGDGDR